MFGLKTAPKRWPVLDAILLWTTAAVLLVLAAAGMLWLRAPDVSDVIQHYERSRSDLAAVVSAGRAERTVKGQVAVYSRLAGLGNIWAMKALTDCDHVATCRASAAAELPHDDVLAAYNGRVLKDFGAFDSRIEGGLLACRLVASRPLYCKRLAKAAAEGGGGVLRAFSAPQ